MSRLDRTDEIIDLFAAEREKVPAPSYLDPTHVRLVTKKLSDVIERWEREDRLMELADIDRMVAESGGMGPWKRIRIVRMGFLNR